MGLKSIGLDWFHSPQGNEEKGISREDHLVLVLKKQNEDINSCFFFSAIYF